MLTNLINTLTRELFGDELFKEKKTPYTPPKKLNVREVVKPTVTPSFTDWSEEFRPGILHKYKNIYLG